MEVQVHFNWHDPMLPAIVVILVDAFLAVAVLFDAAVFLRDDFRTWSNKKQ